MINVYLNQEIKEINVDSNLKEFAPQSTLKNLTYFV